MDTSRTQYVEWWLTTEFGQKKDLRRTINWDSDQKKSAAWSSFDQVAHSKTGEPKVMCKRCCAVVIHPGYKRSGPSPMKNHLTSAQCAKPQLKKTSKQGIDKLLRNMAFMAITGYFIDEDWNYREVLLGFEHQPGSHTGAHLSETILHIFKKHQITNRVLSITTDNASNNTKMIQAVQELAGPLTLGDTPIFRIPCIVHVIQLSLHDLLGKIRANPKNTEAESEWPESRTKSIQSSSEQSSGNITNTLKKIRELAVFINASPQRRDAFQALQTTPIRLLPIQDVRTRWNSTFLMLDRAKRLQQVFDLYCTTHHYSHFKLSAEEWRQVDYLFLITKPFFDMTNVLSKTRDVTVHSVFSIYNKVFNHLDAAEEKLERKGVLWKIKMLQALRAAKAKLRKYYTATDTEPYGAVYAIATILCPSKKLRYFDNEDWRGTHANGEQADFMKIYRDKLQAEFERYKQRILPQINTTEPKASQDDPDDDLAFIMDSQTALQPEVDQPVDEITQYLSKGLTRVNPRLFWKEHEQEYPVLAALARDILSTPASGAGVERLFNCARDICHYRRGKLKPETIKELMLHFFSSKFDLQQSELDLIKEYTLEGEDAILNESWKPSPALNDIDPTSDDEEEGRHQAEELLDEPESDLESEAYLAQTTTQSKRPHQAIEPQDSDDGGLPPPEMPTEEATQGRSGRIRKRPKMPDGF
ncbi:hypothetical protein N7481_001454 [Penicillium waksmanii]|uniref:uncharacterized protein n=1 Tax=Penicillium waksmanii TaxID=69791 RepID=UPI0025472C33|nr:uncharacterized protein N7481_001454 [Penicillium waksmanii]KAJ6001045.1 hypothetical protein N7481_001454 [Penicillium waksmanii]